MRHTGYVRLGRYCGLSWFVVESIEVEWGRCGLFGIGYDVLALCSD
jgi:hypothetical protein